MTSPLVRAVVVNWNGIAMLTACLSSLMEQDLGPGTLEVVLVDNASHDGSVDLVHRDFPSVVVVQNDTNEGFAGGVNAGLVGLRAPYVVLLNNDARLEPDAIRQMVEVLEEPGNADVGAVTALILLDNAESEVRPVVNSTGNIVSRAGSATDRDWLIPLDEVDAPADVFGFCGGAVALRASALEQAGTFDETLFLYYEDTDLSWRLRAQGWQIRFERRAVAWHQHAQSSDRTSPLFRYYNNRNALIVFTRYTSLRTVLRAYARQSAAVLLHAIRHDEAAGLIWARLRALTAALRRAPAEWWRARSARRALRVRGGLDTYFVS